jgi:hypothetical protein
LKKLAYLLLFLALLVPSAAYAQEQDPWGEVFDEHGNLRYDLVDKGVTTENPDWMAVELPFGQSLQFEASYHTYQTANGNTVQMPSATTLFFMATQPEASGLNDSAGMLSNGHGAIITMLGAMAGDSIDWNQVSSDHPEYQKPDQFWGAVINGKEDIWTYFTGWGFITTLLNTSWDDASFYTTYLLYLNETQATPAAATPAATTQPTSKVKATVPVQLPAPRPTSGPVSCPDPSVTVQPAVLSIARTAPNNPLVVGQDPERRGADVRANVTVPPVIYIWYEPLFGLQEYCREAFSGEDIDDQIGPDTGTDDAVCESELVFIGCQEHIEHLPDAVISFLATANLDGASQAWITGQLGQTHYEAYVHQAGFGLIPGIGTWNGGCDGGGTCTARGQALRVPFADPGTFNLRLEVTTSGTHFNGAQITPPRQLSASGNLQVYVTLPALVQ